MLFFVHIQIVHYLLHGNGVIVMVYDEFPPSLIQVKEELELATITYSSPKNPKLKLKKENVGSSSCCI